MDIKSYSIHIGVNRVDPAHYQGWDGALLCCENDAIFYKSVAEKAGFSQTYSLLSSDNNHLPTTSNLSALLKQSSNDLKEGDLLFLSYSGHGGTVPDENNDEGDGADETWCLQDRQFLDDELFEHFRLFKPGVRIIVISDSCHSGTVTKDIPTANEIALEQEVEAVYKKMNLRSRMAPRAVSFAAYAKNRDTYLSAAKKAIVKPEEIKASVLLMAACQDNEKAAEWTEYGLFTTTFKKIVELNKEFNHYEDLFSKIKVDIPSIQNPNLFVYGQNVELLKTEKPFYVNEGKLFSFFNPDRNTASPTATVDEQLIIELKPGTKSFETGNEFKPISTPRTRSAGTEQTPVQYFAKDTGGNGAHAWDRAYQEYVKLSAKGQTVAFIEPDAKTKYLKETPLKRSTAENSYLSSWPKPADNLGVDEFIWHLDDQHSQLKKARERVAERVNSWTDTDKSSFNSSIRVAHIDTGYIPTHPSAPKRILEGTSFVKGENDNKGIDILSNAGKFEQDGHGSATVAILAGNFISAENSYTGYSGDFGGIPFAEVLPVRICDTVFNFFNANDVASGIDYAVEHGCEVITMSMAGYPTRRVAQAVNRAYEKGVVVVTAAGNNWKGGVSSLTPKAIMYPARFDRVIAACGVCYNEEPYDLDVNNWLRMRSEGGENMQGNWGPEKCMDTALAAYTPNLPWVMNSGPFKFSRQGGGTSSATPQIAAAAALWILYNRKGLTEKKYTGTWKQAEAARQALFQSGGRTYPGFKKYYGNGSLKASDALDLSEQILSSELKPADEASVKFLGLTGFVGQWFRAMPTEIAEQSPADESFQEMVSLEILQILYKDPELFSYTNSLDFEKDDSFLKNKAAKDVFIKKVKASAYASETLKKML